MLPLDVGRELYVMPLRATIAKELNSRGWSQREIARAIGVTQVAVSKLLKGRQVIEKMRLLGIEELEIKLLLNSLLEQLEMGRVEKAAALASRYWLLVTASGSACRAHMSFGWKVTPCTACMRSVYPRIAPAKAEALADIERAIFLAESSRLLAKVMPEVLSNVARAIKGASTTSEVVAIPGRLAKVESRVKARSPAFGASRHLAEVLLSSGYASCINIKYDKTVRKALEALGLGFLEFSSEDFPGPNPAAAVLSKIKEEGSVPRVVVDRGGLGIEPVTYIFGATAVEVVLLAEKIAQAAFS
ncbi:MAG: thiamine-phosphate synthase family protein [Thermofilaceae archaeon]